MVQIRGEAIVGQSGPTNGLLTINPGLVTPATGYEIAYVDGQAILRLKKYKDFSLSARTVAAADSEFGRTWLNRTEVASANENTTTANAARWVAATTASDWFSGPYTAAFEHKVFSFGTLSTLEPKVLIARISNNASTNYTGSGIQISKVGDDSAFLRYQIGFAAASEKIISYIGTSAQETAATSGQLTAGIWLRMTFIDGVALLDYNLSTSTTPPTTGWVRDRSVTFVLDPAATYRVGKIQIVNATSSNLITDFLYYDDSGLAAEEGEAANPSWGAQGYLTSGTAVKLLDDVNLLNTAATVSSSELRAALTSCVNTLSGDSATATFSFVMSDSPGASEGTYGGASGGAAVSGGTGTLASLWLKLTSDGTQAGSFNLSAFKTRFSIP